MGKKLVVYFLLLLVLIPGVLAIKTEVTVKTKPNELVSINVFDPISEEKIFNAFERADASGTYATSFSSAVEKVNVEIRSTDDSNVIIGNQQYENYPAGEAINLDFITPLTNNSIEENSTIQSNITENESIRQTNETTINESTNSAPTGFAIKDIFSSRTFYYIIIVLVLVGIVLFVFRMKKKNNYNDKPAEEIKIRKWSDFQAESSLKQAEIAEAEKKIREAQAEINRLRNEDKIEEIKKRIEQDERELLRLRAGR